MVPQFICAGDNEIFTSLEALEAHEKSGHTIKGIPGAKPVNAEFEETLRLIEEDKKKKAAEAPPPPKPSPQTPPRKIELTYQYVGVDSKGHNVVTLEIDIQNRHFVVALCPIENEQLEVREVENLKNDKKNPIGRNSKENFNSGIKTEMEPRAKKSNKPKIER